MVVQLAALGKRLQPKVPDEDVSNLPNTIQETDLAKPETCTLVDTCAGVADLVDTLKDLAEPKGQEDFFDLEDLPVSQPALYIDLKVVQTSRHCSISTMQILASSNNQVFVVDILTLGEKAFSTPGKSGETLKGILQSSWIPKVVFDVRCATDALLSQFQVDLVRVTDLQLMELATRESPKEYVSELAKCIEEDLSLSPGEIKAARDIKEKGLDLLAPECGGSYKIFNVRPLTEDLRLFFIQDVQFMPKLFQQYLSKMTANWAGRVSMESFFRAGWLPESDDGAHEHMARGPEGWEDIQDSDNRFWDQEYDSQGEYVVGALAAWDELGEYDEHYWDKVSTGHGEHMTGRPATWEDLESPTLGWEVI